MITNDDILKRLESLVKEGNRLTKLAYIGEDSAQEEGLTLEWEIKSLLALEDVFGDRRGFLSEFRSQCPIYKLFNFERRSAF
jgi:hypothetical protein